MKSHLAILLLVASVGVLPFALSPTLGAPRPLSHTITLKRTLPKGTLSPDSKSLAHQVKGENFGIASVEIWDVASGKLRQSLKGCDGVFCFSPDGGILATIGQGGGVALWDVRTGKRLHDLHNGMDMVTRVVFSPDGRLMAATLMEDAVCFWDVRSGKLLGERNPTFTSTLAFASDSKTYLVADFSAMRDGKRDLTIAETQTGKVLSTLRYESDIDEAVFSPDGQWIVTVANFEGHNEHKPSSYITIWNLKTKKARHALNFELKKIVPVTLDPKLPEIVTQGNQTLRFLNASTGKLTRAPQGQRGDGIALIITDKKSLQSPRSQTTLTLWRTR